jgi:hypothetical protein
MNKMLCALAMYLGVVASSHANVVYTWKTVAEVPEHNVSVRIEFTDEAVAKGTYQYIYRPSVLGDWQGLVSLSASMQGIGPLYLTPSMRGLDYDPDGRYSEHGEFAANFAFGDGKILSGSLKANNTVSDMNLMGSDGLFSVTRFASDTTTNTFNGPAFPTGMLVDDNGKEPGGSVPEPASLALVGLGVLGLAAGAKRKR